MTVAVFVPLVSLIDDCLGLNIPLCFKHEIFESRSGPSSHVSIHGNGSVRLAGMWELDRSPLLTAWRSRAYGETREFSSRRGRDGTIYTKARKAAAVVSGGARKYSERHPGPPRTGKEPDGWF